MLKQISKRGQPNAIKNEFNDYTPASANNAKFWVL